MGAQAVSRAKSSLDSAVRVVFLILMGLVALVLTDSLFLLIFVPIVAWFLWRLNDRVREMERKLATPDEPSDDEPHKK